MIAPSAGGRTCISHSSVVIRKRSEGDIWGSHNFPREVLHGFSVSKNLYLIGYAKIYSSYH